MRQCGHRLARRAVVAGHPVLGERDPEPPGEGDLVGRDLAAGHVEEEAMLAWPRVARGGKFLSCALYISLAIINTKTWRGHKNDFAAHG
jgi:hypothetical protein